MTSAPMLISDFDHVECLTLWPEDNPDDFQAKLEEKISAVDCGDGVFVLADLFGGTPCNRALYALGDKVRVLGGMSLPMLLSLLNARMDTDDLDEITEAVLAETRVAIVDVNSLIKKRMAQEQETND